MYGIDTPWNKEKAMKLKYFSHWSFQITTIGKRSIIMAYGEKIDR